MFARREATFERIEHIRHVLGAVASPFGCWLVLRGLRTLPCRMERHSVLQGFARLHKLKLEVVPVARWDDLVPALLRRDGDVIAGRFTDTPARRLKIAFTHAVFPTRFAVMTRKPLAPVKRVEELRNLKVGTVKGTPMEEIVRALKVPADNVIDDIALAGGFGAALRSGRIQAAVWGVESILAERLGDPAVQLGMFVGPRENKAFGVRPKDEKFLHRLNEYIDNFRPTPTRNRLVVKYFGSAAPEVLSRAREE